MFSHQHSHNAVIMLSSYHVSMITSSFCHDTSNVSTTLSILCPAKFTQFSRIGLDGVAAWILGLYPFGYVIGRVYTEFREIVKFRIHPRMGRYRHQG
jgi:hypothetical protein